MLLLELVTGGEPLEHSPTVTAAELVVLVVGWAGKLSDVSHVVVGRSGAELGGVEAMAQTGSDANRAGRFPFRFQIREQKRSRPRGWKAARGDPTGISSEIGLGARASLSFEGYPRDRCDTLLLFQRSSNQMWREEFGSKFSMSCAPC